MVRHLYIHIPFCHHICPYCAFYKHQPGKLANRLFVDSLLAEAEARSQDYQVVPKTIYFGGGTPSSLSSALLSKLCEGLRQIFDLSQLEEWTIESNPMTFDANKAQLMHDLGITRPSLGVQSFQNETLQTLGRDHSGDQAIESFQLLKSVGFESTSLDLMFSIPNQTMASWEADLQQVIDLNPNHVSAYNLTYEEDTEFMQRHVSGELDFDEDRDASQFYRTIEILEQQHYSHYEISNYAKPGYESIHNQAYWSGADYLGLGPSAVSTINNQRWKTIPDTAKYVDTIKNNNCQTEAEDLSEADLRIERIALLLRTKQGIPSQIIDDADTVQQLIEEGWLQQSQDHYQLSDKGKALADPIAEALI